jgi:hypothetical protein
MPEMTQVYGGAGRVYPVDLGWTSDPFQSPLHLAYDARGGERATSELIGDALRMARDAGLLSQGARPPRTDQPAGLSRHWSSPLVRSCD